MKRGKGEAEKRRSGETKNRRFFSPGHRLPGSPVHLFPVSPIPRFSGSFLQRRIQISFILLLLLSFSLVCSSATAEQWIKVRWVDDGDTIVLVDGRRIRYIGINAPEIAHQEYHQKAEPLGYEALRYNKILVHKKRVRLEFGSEKHDRYDRVLAYVFLPDSRFVNLEMLRKGYAFCLFRGPNDRYNTLFLKAQREAMKAGRGIWNLWEEAGQEYLGNRRSRRFHLKACPMGRTISPKNRVYFSSRWEAFWAGYAPAKRCQP